MTQRLLLTALLVCAFLGAQQLQVPLEPTRESGQSVTGAFEGWFPNADGTFSLLVGYYNRNSKQEIDIPAGPDNKIEPGPAYQGQPTHFLTGRQWGVFTITVPKDFGVVRKLTWTITANGRSTSVPLNLKDLWEVSPFIDATQNTPPFIGFDEKGPFVQGPKGQSLKMTAVVGAPLTLPVWVADNASSVPGAFAQRTPAVTVGWVKLRGPGTVTFDPDRPPAEPATFAAPPKMGFSGKAVTKAIFSEPGDYVLRVVANDWSGDGGRGFQCCWSNAFVNVSVRAK